jgi:hypothetical protein
VPDIKRKSWVNIKNQSTQKREGRKAINALSGGVFVSTMEPVINQNL